MAVCKGRDKVGWDSWQRRQGSGQGDRWGECLRGIQSPRRKRTGTTVRPSAPGPCPSSRFTVPSRDRSQKAKLPTHDPRAVATSTCFQAQAPRDGALGSDHRNGPRREEGTSGLPLQRTRSPQRGSGWKGPSGSLEDLVASGRSWPPTSPGAGFRPESLNKGPGVE